MRAAGLLLLLLALFLVLLLLTSSRTEPFRNACRPNAPIRGGEASIVFGTRVGATHEKVLVCNAGHTVARLDLFLATDGDSVAGVAAFCGVETACAGMFDAGAVQTATVARTSEPASLDMRVDETADMNWKVAFPVSRQSADEATAAKDEWTGLKVINNGIDGETSLGAALRFAPACADRMGSVKPPFEVRAVKSSSVKAVRVFYDDWFVKGFQLVYELPGGLL